MYPHPSDRGPEKGCHALSTPICSMEVRLGPQEVLLKLLSPLLCRFWEPLSLIKPILRIKQG